MLISIELVIFQGVRTPYHTPLDLCMIFKCQNQLTQTGRVCAHKIDPYQSAQS